MTKEELMRKAIELSTENVANGGGPFGAVIAKDGEIIATGTNRVTSSCDPTAHAEVSAIRSAATSLVAKSIPLVSPAPCASALSIGPDWTKCIMETTRLTPKI